MNHEKLQRDQAFLNFPPVRLQDVVEARKEFLKPCGRYRSPAMLENKISYKFAELFARYDELQEQSKLIGPGIPLNWFQLLEYLKKSNIIERAQFLPVEFSHDRPKLAALHLAAGETTSPTDGQKVYYDGYATADSDEEMMSKVIGETLERYFLTIYRQKDLLMASVQEMKRRGRSMLNVTHLNAYLPWQIEKFKKFGRDESLPFAWVKGDELLTGTKAYIPAQLVYWNYYNAYTSDEPVLADMTTSGSGGHFTRDEAILSALLEAVERDGFMIYWLNALKPAELDLDDCEDPDIQALLAYAKRYQLEMRFLDTTTDIGIPTVTCVLIDRAGPEPIVQLSSATGFVLKDLLVHVGREALMVYSLATKLDNYLLDDDYKPFVDEKISNLERICIWRGEKMLKEFQFFLGGKKRSLKEFIGENEKLETVADRLAHVLNTFKRMGPGYEVYVYEVKARVLDELGYHVVRAVVPQLVPLFLNEHCATLDSKRLREVPGKLGYKARDEYYPWPHPFP